MHSLGRASFLAVIFILIGSNALFAQEGAGAASMEATVAELKAGQEQMQAELAEIKKLLQDGARAAPPAVAAEEVFKPTDINIGPSQVLGNEDAQVTLIGYSDYQCPFCSRHATTVLPELIKKYVDTGKVKIVMREFPIESIHSKALKASEAALCAAEHDKYWEMHDLIFSNIREIDVDHLKAHAQTLGLDAGLFSACLDRNKYVAQIRSDLTEGQKFGVSGTPSFVAGLTDPDNPDKVRLTKFIRGAKALPFFEQAIDELLASAE